MGELGYVTMVVQAPGQLSPGQDWLGAAIGAGASGDGSFHGKRLSKTNSALAPIEDVSARSDG